MSVTLLFLTVVMAIAGWWLWQQGLTTKPWLEEGEIGDGRSTGSTARPAAKTGLGVFLAVVGALFALLISAYSMRSPMGDWLPVPIPKVLWFNTAILIASSISLHFAQIAARRDSMAGVRGGLLAAGITAITFIFGQLVAWQQLTAEGYFLAANPANAFFYLITALHGLHVLGGLVALERTIAKVWGDEPADPSAVASSVELCAIYWHFLLLVWFILLAVLTGWGGQFLAICRQVLI